MMETSSQELLERTDDDTPNIKDKIQQIDSKDGKYYYPYEKRYISKYNPNIEPKGTQWIHDKQTDDEYTDVITKRAKQFDKLSAVVVPEQRSEQWFAMRNNAITASDGGTVLGLNKYEPQYKFLLKKTTETPFQSNKFCYHGKKLENIATMIYSYRMNVTVEEFGLMIHPKYSFLGASPDGICTRYKYNKKNKSALCGRMLEIKCPLSRQLNKDGDIKGDICPIYYWVQVQLQLECCDLDECDFWQCILREYSSRQEFIDDTDENEPFRSKKFGYEKGCLIQLLPKNKLTSINDKEKYDEIVHSDAKFIYPPKIEMTPHECDLWVSEQVSQFTATDEFIFDKVIYWRLEDSHNVIIQRDTKWFAESLIQFQQVWNYVLFLRKNKQALDNLLKFINDNERVYNKAVMNFVEEMYNSKKPITPTFKPTSINIKTDTKIETKKVKVTVTEYEFTESDDEKKVTDTKDQPVTPPPNKVQPNKIQPNKVQPNKTNTYKQSSNKVTATTAVYEFTESDEEKKPVLNKQVKPVINVIKSDVKKTPIIKKHDIFVKASSTTKQTYDEYEFS